MNLSFFGVTMLLVLVGNVLWYYIKYVVKQNGHETHLFWGHLYDIINLYRLIGKEQDVNKKKYYKTLLLAFYFIMVSILASFIMIAY